MRQIIADTQSAIVAAPNFSTGVVVFEAIVARAAQLFAPLEEFGACVHETHHAAKSDAPSGTALLLQRAMVDAGVSAADRHVVHARRLHAWHAHRRIRRSGGDDRR